MRWMDMTGHWILRAIAYPIVLLNWFSICNTLGALSGDFKAGWDLLLYAFSLLMAGAMLWWYGGSLLSDRKTRREARTYEHWKTEAYSLYRPDRDAEGTARYLTPAGEGPGVTTYRGSSLFAHSVFYTHDGTELSGRAGKDRTGKGKGVGASGELIPDGIEPIVGYRAWQIQPSLGRMLYSLAFSTFQWMPGENAANCAAGSGHYVGHPLCTCGFYAYKTRAALSRDMGYMGMPSRVVEVYDQVIGTVDLYGLVTEHELGYRASHAKITGFYATGRIAMRAAELYGVPLLEKLR